MQAITIHEQWCKKQQEDFETMMTAVDDLGAASLALATNGAQGYTQFIQARDNFKQMFSEMSKNYRYVE
jgi:23S rRNA pseudoU1915 N3-methylase RlmH